MKDEKISVAYGRKIKSLSGVQYEMDTYHTAWEATLDPGDDETAIRARKLGELRAELELQIAIDRRDERAERGATTDITDGLAGAVPSGKVRSPVSHATGYVINRPVPEPEGMRKKKWRDAAPVNHDRLAEMGEK